MLANWEGASGVNWMISKLEMLLMTADVAWGASFAEKARSGARCVARWVEARVRELWMVVVILSEKGEGSGSIESRIRMLM